MRPLDYYLEILPENQQTQEVKDLLTEILEDAEAEWDAGYSQGHYEGYPDGHAEGYDLDVKDATPEEDS